MVGETPLTPRSSKMLAVGCSIAAVVSLLISMPQTTKDGKSHALTKTQQKLKSMIQVLTTVDEEEAAAIREYQARRRGS